MYFFIKMLKSLIIFYLLFLECLTFYGQKVLSIHNPIQSGLNTYGIKDFFLVPQDNQYYLVGTEYPDPIHPKAGVRLYESVDLQHWKPTKLLIDIEKLAINKWYKGDLLAPEIHTFKGKYYLIFSARNNQTRPYKKLGIGIAVSDKIDGEYKILTPEKPIAEGNNPTLVFHKDTAYMCYDMDGRFYMANINLDEVALETPPKEILGPTTLQGNYKYLDTPQFFKKDSLYHLTFGQFFGGYIIHIYDMVAKHPMGPYSFNENKILYTWKEAEAEMTSKVNYPSKNYFAPPTQVIFSNQIVQLAHHTFINVYHSSEKYSEPSMCIDEVVFEGNNLKIVAPKAKKYLLKIE